MTDKETIELLKGSNALNAARLVFDLYSGRLEDAQHDNITYLEQCKLQFEAVSKIRDIFRDYYKDATKFI